MAFYDSIDSANWSVWSIPSNKEKDGVVAEIQRIRKILDTIYEELTPYLSEVEDHSVLFVIENIAFGIQKTTSVMQLASLNYMMRDIILKHGFPFIVVPPTTLKKFVIGKGVGEKEFMLLESFKKWGVSFGSNDECDAYGLVRFGEALIDSISKKPKLSLTQPQKETIEVIKPQLYEYITTSTARD